MPIDIEKLESEGKDVSETARESRSPQVAKFLQDNDDSAYTQAEVAKEVTDESGKELQGPHAHSILMGLVKKGKVERKSAPGLNAKGKEQDLIYYHWIGGEEPITDDDGTTDEEPDTE